jgi:CheY-like chemotaxis protein
MVKLKQILINLVGNALKFTEQGSVTVRVHADPTTHRPLAVDVTDTGIGIPLDRQQAIFEAFKQADNTTTRKYGGTGLGLTISRSLCQLMGYRVEVFSEVGKGSTFRLVLAEGAPPPVTARIGPTVPPPVSPPGQPVVDANSHSKRVLVIDDQADSRILLSQYLEDLGCQVWTAPSGPEGLEMARQHHPDLITLDLMMPQVSGFDVLRELKADSAIDHIPVVIVSIVARENRAALFGAVDLLDKPVTREALAEVLARALAPKGARVLIVEDDADARQVLVENLTTLGATTRAAANGREGLEILETFSPDLIILDLMMPVMDGAAFLEALRKDPRFPTLPVVVLTAKELTAEERGRLTAQTSAILRKGGLFEEELKKLVGNLYSEREKLGTPATTATERPA